MNKEEIEAIEMLDKFITEHELFNIKQADNLEGNIKIALNLIDKQQKENEELKEDMCKLINYIAIREDKTHEEVCKEFDI